MGNNLVSGSVDPVISLETARAHVSTEEYNRIQAAFSRLKKTHFTLEDFCQYVLGGVALLPEEQRRLFEFCSRGSDVLSFENLLCSLVGLCRVQSVQSIFIEEYSQFKDWRAVPPLLTLPMKDDYISFYEVMSYVTHLAVEEVMELEKVFATISDRTVCKMSRERWDDCLAGCYPENFSNRLFCIFDENGDGFIDFRELVCALSAICRGPLPSRLSLLARLWDVDGDNLLSDVELQAMYDELRVPVEHQTVQKSRGEKAAGVDFANWSFDNDYAKQVHTMANEIGHICLGLRPESAKLEHAIVRSFESRSRNISLPERNIVSSLWHEQWEKSTSEGKTPPAVDNSAIRGTKGDSDWSAKVACISSESTSLRADLAESEYIAVPTPLWRAWLRWHGSALNVDSQFTRKYLAGSYFDDGKPGLELYPLNILFMGHDKKRPRDLDGVQQTSPWACAQVSRCTTVEELLQLCITELRLKEGESRLWLTSKVKDSEETLTLLDDGLRTLFDLGLTGKKITKFLLEVRDPTTGVWPEELRASVTGTQITSIASNTSARPGAVGLVNSGNYCYSNAAVQCLARVTPLTEYILEDEHISLLSKNTSVSTPALNAVVEYGALLKELFAGKKKNISPHSFNNAVRAASDMFEVGEQHDCQEFVSFLLESLHNCMHKNSTELIYADNKSEAQVQSSEEGVKADYEWTRYLEREDSLITELFSGQLRSRLVCRACNHTSTVFEPFTSLSLPIGFDNIDLYQIIVVRRDGSIPKRFGFRLPRDSTVGYFKGLVADAALLDPNTITIQFLGSRSSTIDSGDVQIPDSVPLRHFPSGSRLFALELPSAEQQWRVAAHRKLQYNYEPYLLGSTGGCVVSRFGLPLILPCSEGMTGKELYDDVMHQMKRFMESTTTALTSRAMDPCEDLSSGYPFVLSKVNSGWQWCGICPPIRFCRGCAIPASKEKISIPSNCFIAVDWLPIALYLKYNHSQELACIDDASVSETWNKHVAPSSLQECLEKFSTAETLEESLHCEKCERKTTRDKHISIWRLPKYWIVHLKRFEYLRSERRMGKCKRTIDFPLNNFDPSPFVDRPDGGFYDCIAMANHYGQLSSGHFVAYARGVDDKWLLLNDCSVREVLEEEVDKTAAYLLFFERRFPSVN